MKRKILITLFLLIATYLAYSYGMDIFNHYYYQFIKVMNPPLSIPSSGGLPPPPPMKMEAGPLKVFIDSATPWESIAKLMCTVLGTYLGIKLINKYVK